ncbi:MAG: SIS domain-containing protein [Chloroflexota bacterium]|nr:SIS domain-containing protein [Chloroflexota bacterium]
MSPAAGPEEMGRELSQGPDAVESTLAEVRRLHPKLSPLLASARRIVLVGTGASLAVARTAAPLWRGSTEQGLVVRQSTEIALGNLDGDHFAASDLVIAISQSGTSAETLAAARRADMSGCRVLGITAHGDAPLSAATSHTLLVQSGDEQGASTMSALATLAALLGLAGLLPVDAAGAAVLAGRLRTTAASENDMEASARLLAGARHVWFIGFGAGLGIAEAGALLWHEKVVRQAMATTPSELRHGPIEAVGADDAIVLIDVDRPSPDRAAYLALLRAEVAQLGAALIELPSTAEGEPPARAMAALLRVQQLARATALAAGTYREGFAVLRHVVTAADRLFEL